jgi:O-antigen/teichoic acid export membrane protein
MSHLQYRGTSIARKLHRVFEFFTSQGITVAGNLFYGFLCVRLLPISEYAKFTVVFAVLGTISLLMDISFSSTLLPLIGERTDDRQLIADYVASLRQLAHWLFLAMAPITVIAYPFFVRKQHWSWPVVAAMVVILLVAAWYARVSGAYAVVLLVRRDRKPWYRAQMISSLGTLGLLTVFWAAHALNAFSAILLNVAGIVFVALSYFFRAKHLLGVIGKPSRQLRREIIHLSLPTIPNAVFYALQGQVSLLLITLFGHAAEVANVGALGRLGQIFALFSQMSPLLIEPYFASLPEARLKRSYLGLVAAEGVLCLLVTGVARAFPEPFLWILGHNYRGLGYEVFLVMASSSLAYFGSVLLFVHNARRFTYWWNGGAFISLTLLVQIYFLCKVDLSSLRSILIMNLCTSLAGLAVALFTGIYGFVRGPRSLAEAPPAVAAGIDHV